jgi:hypothetical protein
MRALDLTLILTIFAGAGRARFGVVAAPRGDAAAVAGR